MLYYAGIGSRNTPKHIMEEMAKIATKLEKKGYTLRSGGAGGADLAFESGVEKLKEIYLPWRGFNNSNSNFYNISKEALDTVEKYHPNETYMKRSVKNLMARNAYQVLGEDLNTPVDFVICWTPDGAESDKERNQKTGGTGQAISIADDNNIRVYNIENESSYEELIKMIDTLGEKEKTFDKSFLNSSPGF